MSENEWRLLYASKDRFTRYYVSTDGWLHLEVTTFGAIDGDNEQRRRTISITAQEFDQLVIASRDGQQRTEPAVRGPRE